MVCSRPKTSLHMGGSQVHNHTICSDKQHRFCFPTITSHIVCGVLNPGTGDDCVARRQHRAAKHCVDHMVKRHTSCFTIEGFGSQKWARCVSGLGFLPGPTAECLGRQETDPHLYPLSPCQCSSAKLKADPSCRVCHAG